jgi:L-asparaginase II
LQALPLIETGAADQFGLGEAEIALACASHNGEPRHVGTVLAWLERVGLSVGDLECGSHLPYHEPSAEALIREGAAPTPAHNNCSGKHAGFLTTAVHAGEPTRGYIQPDHPVQRRILGVLEQMTGLDLGRAPRGIDGCGIPVIGIPLGHTAMAMARLADTAGLPPARAAAAGQILQAMSAEPFLVAGTNRFCTRVMQVMAGAVVIKTGAEGVYAASLPGLGLGVALKVDDGAGRAAEVAMGQVLRHVGLLTEEQAAALAATLAPPLRNRAGRVTGRVQPAPDSPL